MLKDLIRSKMVEAMKAGDKDSKQTYSLLLQSLQKAEKAKLSDLTEQEEITVLSKYAKQVKESIDTCPADRTETLVKLNQEFNLVTQFLPKQLDESEINTIIDEVLAELNITSPTSKDKGMIMKSLMPRTKGKADGKLVNTLLSKRFS